MSSADRPGAAAPFWRGKRIFLTGHTGFKGSWLSIWLHALGGRVFGYALPPPTNPSLFALAKVDALIERSTIGDVRDAAALADAVAAAAPEVVIHMAAQPLVRESYRDPVGTIATNVMGTVHLLEAVRRQRGVRAIVNVTSDKCYENREWPWGYRENEAMGGYDPYASSKGCSELVTAAYRQSFFNPKDHRSHVVAIASARAGNVIGGGDWAADRLVPDCIRAILEGKPVVVRNPRATRPWQHVLEPLGGYLLLARKLCEDGPAYSEAWNFGPDGSDDRPVGWLVEKLCAAWGPGATFTVDGGPHPHEAAYLKLDSSKARMRLAWSPRWSLEKAIDAVVEWTTDYRAGSDVRARCLSQIRDYESSPADSEAAR